MMVVIDWLKRWGWVALVLVGGIVVLALTAGKVKLPMKEALAGAKAEQDAAKLVATMGHEAAVTRILEQHRAAVQKLDDQQKVWAEELKKDPKKLAKFLAGVANT